MEYPFDCPLCGERYHREESIVRDEAYGDSICFHCADELQAERHSLAHAEIGDQT